MRPLLSTNPSNGLVYAQTNQLTPQEITLELEACRRAQKNWRKLSYAERAPYMQRVANTLRERIDHLARTITTEMGKPITQAKAEIEKSALLCEYYVQETENFLADQHVSTDATQSLYTYEPIGIVLGIMPWNFPIWQAIRTIAPILMAGNGYALKHAPASQQCADAIDSIFRRAGIPENLLVNLPIENQYAEIAINHPAIQAITMTGSTAAGKIVASQAGAQMKKCLFELGSNDPFIVLADADIEKAAQCAVDARLINCGQVCIAPKRIIVDNSIRSQFLDAVIEKSSAYQPQDPISPESKLGPIARADLLERIHKQVEQSVASGAKLIRGGKLRDDPGNWYEPTILADAPSNSPAGCEEIFGPVFSIVGAKNERDAIAQANATDFGLSASIFTADTEKAEYLARKEIEAGMVFVNNFVKSDPRLPFGGIKHSGYGREMGPHGLTEFTNIKTISIA